MSHNQLANEETPISFKIGDKMPDFTLPDVNGKTVRLSELTKEQSVVIVFYRGGWCPLCSKQLATLSADFEKFEQKGVTLVAISNEAPEQGVNLLAKLRLPYYLLTDTQSKVISLYGVRVKKRELADIPALLGRRRDYAMPAVFIINKQGNLAWNYIGKTYRDRPDNKKILAHLN